MYSSEQELVACFLEQLADHNPWDSPTYRTEFNYSRGKTDIVTISRNDEVIAIEAKLSRWKNALQQAYRNRCFADKSYVLLPLDVAQKASQYSREFERRGVGICCLQNGNITILKEATADEPIQGWLRQAAFKFTVSGDNDACDMRA